MRQLLTLVVFGLLILPAPVTGQDYRFGKVSPEELQMESDGTFPDADALILYNDISMDYGRELKIHKRIKILSKTGLEHSDWVIPFGEAKGVKAASYTLEGGELKRTRVTSQNIFEEEVSEDEKVIKIAFPNVKVGSVIELKYHVPFMGLSRIYTQEFLPIKKIRVMVNNPNYLSLEVKENPYVEIPLRRIEKDFSFLFIGEDIPPLRKEGFVSNINNHRGQLMIEVYGKFKMDSWSLLTTGLNRAEWFGGQLNHKGRFLKDEVARFKAKGLDSLSLLKEVDNYFKENFNWNRYYGVGSEDIKVVYNERAGSSGDINLLMTYLLRELGFNAHPMLIASKARGWVMYPRLSSFNSLICVVWLDGKEYFMDGTRKNGVFGRIALPYANDRGFVPRGKNGYLLQPVLIKEPSTKTTIVQLNVDLEQNVLKGKYRQQLADYFAWNFRNRLIEEDKDFYSREMESIDLLNITDWKTSNLSDREKPIMTTFDFVYEGGVEAIGSQLFLEPLAFLKLDENPFNENAAERLYPIDIKFPYSSRYILNVAIPEGYELSYIPEAFNYTLPDDLGSLSFGGKAMGANLQLNVQLQLNKQIMDAKYYGVIQQLFTHLREFSTSKIVFNKLP